MSVSMQCDRMAADCAVELHKHHVAFVSLWPGPARTEIFVDIVNKGLTKNLSLGSTLTTNQVGLMIRIRLKCLLGHYLKCSRDSVPSLYLNILFLVENTN